MNFKLSATDPDTGESTSPTVGSIDDFRVKSIHSLGTARFKSLMACMHALLLHNAVICVSVTAKVEAGSYSESLRHNLTFVFARSFDNADISQGTAAMLVSSAMAIKTEIATVANISKFLDKNKINHTQGGKK
ncbi:hypothetical protein Plhal304r1_c058g0145091 [Plasmopara halstedii]